jgi:hypothetical protein
MTAIRTLIAAFATAILDLRKSPSEDQAARAGIHPACGFRMPSASSTIDLFALGASHEHFMFADDVRLAVYPECRRGIVSSVFCP